MIDLSVLVDYEKEELKRELKFRNEELEDLEYLERDEIKNEFIVIWSKLFVYLTTFEENNMWFVSVKRNYNK